MLFQQLECMTQNNLEIFRQTELNFPKFNSVFLCDLIRNFQSLQNNDSIRIVQDYHTYIIQK